MQWARIAGQLSTPPEAGAGCFWRGYFNILIAGEGGRRAALAGVVAGWQEREGGAPRLPAWLPDSTARRDRRSARASVVAAQQDGVVAGQRRDEGFNAPQDGRLPRTAMRGAADELAGPGDGVTAAAEPLPLKPHHGHGHACAKYIHLPVLAVSTGRA